MTKCWCGTEAQPWLSEDYDRCPADGTLVLKDEKRVQDLKNFYTKDGYWEDYIADRFGFPTLEERREAMLPRSGWWLAAIRSVIGAPRSIYELGSAEGTFLTLAREDGIEVLGHDVDEATAAWVRQTHDIDCISGLYPESKPERTFDVVAGFDVLEHVPDPVEFIRAAYAQAERLLVFQTPCYREEGPTFKHLKAPEHIFIWTPHAAVDLYRKAGIPVEVTSAFFAKDMMLWSRK